VAPAAGATPRVRRATKAAAPATGEDTQASQAEPEEVTMSETVTEQTTVVPTQKRPGEPSEEHDALVVPSEKPLPEDRYLNRELSWLDFNARVLTLAEDPSTPLLERAKFLAIFASNLDEFYMVRVAGLKRRLQTGIPVRRPGFLPPTEQLEQIAERTTALVAR
jgi:polyphosphate kinase